MKKDRLLKLSGIAAIITVLLLVSSAAGLISLPKSFQKSYLSVFYKITNAEGNSERLADLHQATQIDDKADPYTTKYTDKHRNIIKSDSARCEACHGNMLDEENGKPKSPIHKKMLDAPMLSFSCTDCHKKVDLGKRSPSRVTRTVDRTLCPACHEPSGGQADATTSGGKSWAESSGIELPNLMSRHGKDEKGGKKWIKDHPRVAMSVGIDQCKKCHIEGSELDFCRECHTRGGFRPSTHRAVYKVRINELYPDKARTDVVETKWRGYHFVFVREALAKLGAKVDSPRNLPFEKLQKLPCGACHRLKDWCTRCHIKHAPNWLDPNKGHPAYVDKYGKRYCKRCHDSLGSKCVSCHSYVGRLQ